MVYMNNRALEGLKAYQYKSGGTTMLDDLHQPFWNYLTQLCPMWLAPNLITLTGIMGLVFAYLVDVYYLPNMAGEGPRWMYALSGFAVIFYVHLDCIDGKQARRTRSSSPLGQLFDHGCDAISLHLMLANVHCTINYPCNVTSSIVTTAVMVPWVVAHWEEYHTGTLLYGNGWFGVLEANYTLAMTHVLAAIFGPGYWDIVVWPMLPAPLSFPLTLRHLFFIATIAMGIIQVSGQLYRVSTFMAADLPLEERGHKELGWHHRLRHLAWIAALLILGTAWAADPNVQWGQCRSAIFSYGVIYALVASQMIVDHMSKEPFHPPYWAFAVLLVGCVNTWFRFVPARELDWALNAVVLAGYLHWVTSVVTQICDFLGIKCFTIKSSKQ